MLSTTATIDFAIEVFRVLSTIAVWSPVALFAMIAVKQGLESSIVTETVKPYQPKTPSTETPKVKTPTAKIATPAIAQKTPTPKTLKPRAAQPSKKAKRPTIAQLKSRAKTQGLKGYSKASRAQLERMLA